ncbi:Transcription initiation factor TFIID subunit 5 [Globomyces sp. JEL0801]|nr:Transcription initiation factor TFIID subunit 5 [Globomyces sp. JEL0801]
MSDSISDRIVATYLAKRGNSLVLIIGFKSSENIFKQESRLKDNILDQLDENSISNYVLFYNEDEANNPKSYDTSYQKLLKWVDDSIDIYKLELRRILFPVFVHAYLDLVSKSLRDHASQFYEQHHTDHLEDHPTQIQRLKGVTDPIHMAENELVVNFRNNKYGVRMSKYSFELLLCFLQDNKFMLILRLMNQYITIQASSDKPGQAVEEAGSAGTGLIGTDSSLSVFNQQPVQLGKLPIDSTFYGDIERALGIQIHSDSALLLEDVQKILSSTADGDAPQPDGVPLPPKNLTDLNSELATLRDIRERVNLSSTTLPSICCYTFHNTGDLINCLKASSNAEYLAAGLADSFVKLWSVTATKPDVPAPPPINLIGHSGPVYGLDFSSDGNYLVSSSEDKTVRLWSLATKTNVVCYKGHNYPVFDVAFAQQGFYFATASVDKTARLWSCDHLFPLRLFVGHLSDVDVRSSDHTCRLWDIQKGTCVRIFPKHNGAVTAMAVSPNGRLMASAGADHVIRLWDLGQGTLIKTMVGHESQITSLDFSKNGALLASSSDDDTVRIWDVLKTESTVDLTKVLGYECIQSYPTKHTPVYSVSFTNRNVLVALGVFQK